MEKLNLPLVSVVISTYNRINSLPVSVSSVLNQTYRNLELIIMDDGSDDGTEEYVKGKAYEDFEFSLRFARNHKIGFVEEPLLKVNSSPNSVNKQFGERIRTQFYMVREMLGALREQKLLGDKLWIILCESELHLCHDIFIEELREKLKQIVGSAEAFVSHYDFSGEVKALYAMINQGLETEDSTETAKLYLLADIVELFEMLEKQITS